VDVGGAAEIEEAQNASTPAQLPPTFKEGGLQRAISRAVADVQAWLDSGDNFQEHRFAHRKWTASSINSMSTVAASEWAGLTDELSRGSTSKYSAETRSSSEVSTAASIPWLRSSTPGTPVLRKASKRLCVVLVPRKARRRPCVRLPLEPLETDETDPMDSLPSKERDTKTDCSVAAAKLTTSCSRQQPAPSLVETELRTPRPDTLSVASARADFKGHAYRLAEDANDQAWPMAPRRRVLPSVDGAQHKEVGRIDAFIQAESVPMLNPLRPPASPRVTPCSPRTFRRSSDLDLRCGEGEVNEKPGERSLQSPQNLIWRHSVVDPPRSAAGAGCTLGMSVTKHSKALDLTLSGVGGLPIKLSEIAPVSSPRAMKSSRALPASPRFRRASV